jgi:hypothetical protein
LVRVDKVALFGGVTDTLILVVCVREEEVPVKITVAVVADVDLFVKKVTL